MRPILTVSCAYAPLDSRATAIVTMISRLNMVILPDCLRLIVGPTIPLLQPKPWETRDEELQGRGIRPASAESRDAQSLAQGHRGAAARHGCRRLPQRRASVG